MHEKHSIFRRAVGFVDGCEIPLQFEPKNHHETYYSRHKQYGFQMQVVCDWDARIRYAYTGNQASVQDSTALRTTGLWRERNHHFGDEEYLIGDKGYFTDKHLVIPYKKPLANRLPGATKFNDTIASVCTLNTTYNCPKLIKKNRNESELSMCLAGLKLAGARYVVFLFASWTMSNTITAGQTSG
jgi:hypothetical protein